MLLSCRRAAGLASRRLSFLYTAASGSVSKLSQRPCVTPTPVCERNASEAAAGRALPASPNPHPHPGSFYRRIPQLLGLLPLSQRASCRKPSQADRRKRMLSGEAAASPQPAPQPRRGGGTGTGTEGGGSGQSGGASAAAAAAAGGRRGAGRGGLRRCGAARARARWGWRCGFETGAWRYRPLGRAGPRCAWRRPRCSSPRRPVSV